MQVNSSSSSSYLTEITQNNNKTRNSSKGNNFPNTQDTVSISAEAFALAQDMYLQNRADFAKQQMEDQPDTANAGGAGANDNKSAEGSTLKDIFHSYLYDSSGRRNKSVGADGAPSAENNAEQQLKEIERQIKTLQGEIEAIGSSDMPEVAKEMRIGELQKEISGLLIQKSALKSGMSAETTTSTPSRISMVAAASKK